MGIEDSIEYGAELITNGTFETNTSGWLGTRSGVLSHVSPEGQLRIAHGGQTSFAASHQAAIPLVTGKWYRAKFDWVSRSATNVQCTGILRTHKTSALTGGVLAPQMNVAYSQVGMTMWSIFKATTDDDAYFHINGGNAAGSNIVIDNVSIQEVISFGSSGGSSGGGARIIRN